MSQTRFTRYPRSQHQIKSEFITSTDTSTKVIIHTPFSIPLYIFPQIYKKYLKLAADTPPPSPHTIFNCDAAMFVHSYRPSNFTRPNCKFFFFAFCHCENFVGNLRDAMSIGI